MKEWQWEKALLLGWERMGRPEVGWCTFTVPWKRDSETWGQLRQRGRVDVGKVEEEVIGLREVDMQKWMLSVKPAEAVMGLHVMGPQIYAMVQYWWRRVWDRFKRQCGDVRGNRVVERTKQDVPHIHLLFACADVGAALDALLDAWEAVVPNVHWAALKGEVVGSDREYVKEKVVYLAKYISKDVGLLSGVRSVQQLGWEIPLFGQERDFRTKDGLVVDRRELLRLRRIVRAFVVESLVYPAEWMRTEHGRGVIVEEALGRDVMEDAMDWDELERRMGLRGLPVPWREKPPVWLQWRGGDTMSIDEHARMYPLV